MKDKLNFFTNKCDIETIITNENIINITGMIGSGKTTAANIYRKNSNYLVISLDCLFKGQDKENMNPETMEINHILKKKYLNKDNKQYFKKYYDEVITYINNDHKHRIGVVEGQQIYRFLNINEVRGKLIIKRTSIYQCWKRSIKRHLNRKLISLRKKEITKKEYLTDVFYWVKRRTVQLKYYRKLNEFIGQI